MFDSHKAHIYLKYIDIDIILKMINLDTKEIMSIIKVISINIEIFVIKIIVALVFEIDNNSIYTKIALIE